MKKTTWIWLATVLILIMIVVYGYLPLDNLKAIPGGFEKVAYVRNENNQGGIYQYYIYTVQDTARAEYQKLMDKLPFNGKTGRVTVYFFYKNAPYPTSIQYTSPHFDEQTYQALRVYSRSKAGL